MGTARKYEPNGPSAEDRALDRFAEMMIEKIESLQSDWKKPWFTEGMMAWPRNLSGREYNGQNALMLMLHCEDKGYKLPVFMTFDRCVALNYTKDREGNRTEAVSDQGEPLPRVGVNKGEKSFPVFVTTFTCVHKETKEKIKYDAYKQLGEEEKKAYTVYPKLQVYNVFNVEQTNLKEARPEYYAQLEKANTVERPEPVEGEEFRFEPMDVMIRDNRWICPIKLEHQDSAFYSISSNAITLPEKSQFVDGESFYGTAFHEMGHSTGAEAHLNRFHSGEGNGGFGSAEYAREELVAELTSALIAQRYGIAKHLKEDSAAYLKAWLTSLKESPDFIKTTLADVKKASGMLCQHIDEIKEELAKEKDEEMEYGGEEASMELENSMGLGTSGGLETSMDQNDGESRVDGLERSDGEDREFDSGRTDGESRSDDRKNSDGESRGENRPSGEENRPDEKNGESPKEESTQMGLRDLGEYDIPEWALVYMEYGDPSGLTEEEIALTDQFCRTNFPNGFMMNVDWDNANELNAYPAFGERNPHALTSHGESPYLACKTYPVEFFDSRVLVQSRNETPPTAKEETAAMAVPQPEEEHEIRHGRFR
jgi:antirestriction protein ArdC